ncbi:MAG: tetratricopeptide repeat protein [Verrucomicrobiae bacterium]|nr:tetratricopeptide repeat protein [Verrucomicrobiae bacterium]
MVPDHELLRPIGRGSYGEVWLARSVLGELRAVKVVRHFGAGDSGPAGREFDGLRKFEPVSRSHEGLVHILHAGRFEGGFYYVMELADPTEQPWGGTQDSAGRERSGAVESAAGNTGSTGNGSAVTDYSPRTLRSDLRTRGRLPIAECLDLALKLTDALAHLHGNGLVHRDLKPSNIIFVKGRPKLADIGLVASADASMSCVGTEGYLPPEGPGKPPADLYALGKVLYELATGRDRTDFPELPTLLREDTQRGAMEEFNEVILKACDPDQRRRYQSAAQMRADLLLMQSGRSLRGARTLRQRLLFARRAGAVVGLAALLAVAAYFHQETQTREARRLARAEAEQRSRAESLVNTLQLKQAERFFEKGEGNQGVAYLARMLRQNPGNQIAAARLMSALNDRSFALPVRVFEFPESIEDLEFSPDGSRFVTWTRGTNHLARLWDMATGRTIGEPFAHVLSEIRPRFSPDGAWLATVSTNHQVQLRDGATGESVAMPLGHDSAIHDLRFSPDSLKLVVAFMNKAHVWKLPGGEQAQMSLEMGSDRLRRAWFSPDGGHIATITFSGGMEFWDAGTGQNVRGLHPAGLDSAWIRDGVFSPDGRTVAAGTDTTLVVWDVASRRVLHHLWHGARVYEIGFSPDSLRLVTGDDQRWVRVWDVLTGRSLTPPIRHGMDVWAAQFDLTGERLLTRERARARVWDSRTGRPLTEWIGDTWRAHFTPDGRHLLTHEHREGVLREVRPGRAFNLVLHHTHGVSSAQFNRSGRRVVAVAGGGRQGLGAGEVGEVATWDADSGTLAAPRIHLRDGVVFAERSPDEHSIVTVSPLGHAQSWDARSARRLVRQRWQDAPLRLARHSPDGRRLLTGSWDGTVRLWETATGRPLGDPLVLSNFVDVVEYSPDGERAVILSDTESFAERAVGIWNLKSGEWTDLNTPGGSRIRDAHFNPDGTQVVGAGLDNSAGVVWDAITGDVLGKPLQHQGTLWSARYSPDGRRVVTASTDQTARVWDSRTLEPVGEAMTHEGLVVGAAFSPDSRRVVTFSTADHAARVWDAETGQPLTELLRHEDQVVAGEFSPDGRRVLTASLDGTARLWDLPQVDGPVPGWLLDLAEATAGQRLVDHELPEAVSAKEFLALRSRILESQETDRYTTWAKWFLADRLERGVSFDSRVTVKDHRARLLERGLVATLREAVQLVPDDAEATARLAREVLAQNPAEYPHPEQVAAFLVGRTERLAPDTLQTWWARAEVLARTNHFDGALEAIERALSHAPADPRLWTSKAGWLERSGRLEAALPAYAQAIALLEGSSGGPASAETGRLSGNGERSFDVQEDGLHPAVSALQVSLPSESEPRRGIRLRRAELLKQLGRHDEAVAERLTALGIPSRASTTPHALLDLSPYYSVSLQDDVVPWDDWRTEENLSELTPGEHYLGGVRFDIRGVVLAGHSPSSHDRKHLAEHVRGIRVAQHCERLHFLHAIFYLGQEGVAAARYLVHYEDGSREEIPILHDRSIGTWTGGTGGGQGELFRVWAGTGEPTPARRTDGNLYRFAWENPRPGLRIESVDFESPTVSAGAGTQAILLAAITAQAEPTPQITRQPFRQTVRLGEPAVFEVEAHSEVGLAYQWQFNGNDLPGATNAMLSIPQARRELAGAYTVKVRNLVPESVRVLTSEPAALAIRDDSLIFGLLRREMFTNLPGNKLPALTNSVRFPLQPDSVDFVPHFEAPADIMNHYGVRLTGILVPPRTGEYRFYLCSDDEGALYLSSDESPVPMRLIAREPDWSLNRAWTVRHQRPNEENVSPPIQLEAGRRYYVEARMKEAEGGDNLAVAWQMPGEPPPRNGSPPISGRYLAVPDDWVAAAE